MKRRYKVNELFFRKRTPEMAYILGFIAADGCVEVEPYPQTSEEISLT